MQIRDKFVREGENLKPLALQGRGMEVGFSRSREKSGVSSGLFLLQVFSGK